MKKLIPISLLIVLSSCQMDSRKDIGIDSVACTNNKTCNEGAIKSSQLYDMNSSETIIHEVSISGDCLNIGFSMVGCSEGDWDVKLIDSGRIAESYPVQRYLKLLVENPGDCKVKITKNISFNIGCLKTQGDSMLLNLKNWEQQIHYTY